MRNGNVKKSNILKNKNIMIILSVVVVMIILSIILFIYNGNKASESSEKKEINSEENEQPIVILKEEKIVSDNKSKIIYKWLPKAYKEAILPFTDEFMLEVAMDKMMESSEEPDFSVSNVDSQIKDIFGENTAINKKNVTTQDISNSLYYYDSEADIYAVIPVGLVGLYRMQILKEVTESEDAYYVYTYMLMGQYLYDTDDTVSIENVDYDNAPVTVVIGDKDGKDLVQKLDSASSMYDETLWLKNHGKTMPICRYTLKKSDSGYYLTEVEQIGY